jgi:hypothetical protein
MAKSIEVKTIREKGPVALVEWIAPDGLKRGIVPIEAVAKGRVDRDELKCAIPYGEPWEELVTVSATPQKIAAELRRVGIWTKEDLEVRPNQAMSAIQAAYGCSLADLLRAVRQQE